MDFHLLLLCLTTLGVCVPAGFFGCPSGSNAWFVFAFVLLSHNRPLSATFWVFLHSFALIDNIMTRALEFTQMCGPLRVRTYAI